MRVKSSSSFMFENMLSLNLVILNFCENSRNTSFFFECLLKFFFRDLNLFSKKLFNYLQFSGTKCVGFYYSHI